ncbi:MAG: hypothetical protein ACE5G1_12310 [bacterium]
MKQDFEIIYIGDPMCSWCWGFAPVLDQIIEKFGDRAGFRIIVGGLRPGEHAQLMTDEVKSYIRTHWQQLGIKGFPSVILRNARRMGLLTAGYQPYENLMRRLEIFLNQQLI